MCDKCVQWDGYTWHMRTGKSYYERRVLLHREIWEAANGPIPTGYDIHHKNDNKTDNRLENLELLTHGKHSALHYQEKLAPHRQKAMDNAKAAWQYNQSIRMQRDLVCARCGTIYHSPSAHPIRYCATACVEAARSGAFTGETRKCEFCATEYQATKRVQRYCSKPCNIRATEKRKTTLVLRTIHCARCGKAFDSKRVNARFCTHECALTFHEGNRFRGKIRDAL